MSQSLLRRVKTGNNFSLKKKKLCWAELGLFFFFFFLVFKSTPVPLKTNQAHTRASVRGERNTGIICLLLGELDLPLQPLLSKDRQYNTCNQPLGVLADFWLILWS